MKIKKAEFVGSFVREEKCPQERIHEYAFIGRSNVGKSSLVNYLLNQKELAKVSGTPGKTQTINFFNVNDKWHLVDLPGYGYARISKDKREEWFRFIRYYLKNRKQLVCTFILIDSRILPQKVDMEFINWMGENRLPFAIIFTKADKLKNPDLIINTDAFKKKLLENWEELPPMFITSSFRKHGGDNILGYIEECNSITLQEG